MKHLIAVITLLGLSMVFEVAHDWQAPTTFYSVKNQEGFELKMTKIPVRGPKYAPLLETSGGTREVKNKKLAISPTSCFLVLNDMSLCQWIEVL